MKKTENKSLLTPFDIVYVQGDSEVTLADGIQQFTSAVRLALAFHENSNIPHIILVRQNGQDLVKFIYGYEAPKN